MLFTRRAPIVVARTSSPIDQGVTGGTAWPGALRVWDSTAPRKLQVENVGVCSYRCSEWLVSSGAMGVGMAAGSQIPLLHAHLVIVQLGVNEMNTGVDAAAYQANLTALIGQRAAAGPTCSCACRRPRLAPMRWTWRITPPYRSPAPPMSARRVDRHAGIGFDVAMDLADLVHRRRWKPQYPKRRRRR